MKEQQFYAICISKFTWVFSCLVLLIMDVPYYYINLPGLMYIGPMQAPVGSEADSVGSDV